MAIVDPTSMFSGECGVLSTFPGITNFKSFVILFYPFKVELRLGVVLWGPLSFALKECIEFSFFCPVNFVQQSFFFFFFSLPFFSDSETASTAFPR